MTEELSGLIEHPMGADGERRTQDSIHGEEATEMFESVITKLKREKRKDHTRMDQLSKDLDELRKENERLKTMCASLQAQVCLSLHLCGRDQVKCVVSAQVQPGTEGGESGLGASMNTSVVDSVTQTNRLQNITHTCTHLTNFSIILLLHLTVQISRMVTLLSHTLTPSLSVILTRLV